jgi:hypothetical protein
MVEPNVSLVIVGRPVVPRGNEQQKREQSVRDDCRWKPSSLIERYSSIAGCVATTADKIEVNGGDESSAGNVPHEDEDDGTMNTVRACDESQGQMRAKPAQLTGEEKDS